ncbi:MAG: septum formation initiator family protein [Thermoleophilia bacterium]|nr:septum formation initiator family protein [Thermoleophilia bacterium]
MTNASVPAAPARSGDIGLEAQPRPPYATRRRILVLVAMVVVLAVAGLANYGPVRDYKDARERLREATTELATLEEQKADLQAQLGKLTEAGYLESLAREELTYARPGEELYIITGAEETAEGDAGVDAGLLQQVISEFEGLD